jgi:hypothetical protein
MRFHYGNTVAIQINGKLVRTFKVVQTKSCCDKILSRYVVHKFGYVYGTFTLIKM